MNHVLLFNQEDDSSQHSTSTLVAINKLESMLSNADTLKKLSKLLEEVKNSMKEFRHDQLALSSLKKVRQRAYWQKQQLLKQEAAKITNQIKEEMVELEDVSIGACSGIKSSAVGVATKPYSETIKESDNRAQDQSFLDGVMQAIRSIDGEAFARKSPKFLALFIATLGVSWLLWRQSVDLYKASGFDEPELIALGGIAMALGFSILYGIKRRWWALLLCLYAGCYEVYFISSGTYQAEIQIQQTAIAKAQGIDWQKEKLRRLKADYENHLRRYDDPSSKVNQNAWYKKKYLDPAWKLYSEAQSKLQTSGEKFEKASSFDHTGWLKVLYRLGLLGLMMVLGHGMVGVE